VRVRLRSEGGFGLIELLMAMVMLNVGILAIVASYNAGIVSLNRASRLSTASTLADAQMELYRALTWSAIALDPSTIPATAPYTTDRGLQRDPGDGNLRRRQPVQREQGRDGPDRKPYRSTATSFSRPPRRTRRRRRTGARCGSSPWSSATERI
jgi:type II secretory pathway pseudopilin PulG